MSINKFGVGDRKKAIKSSEYSISRQIETVLRTKRFLHVVDEAFHAQNKRITHLDSPKNPSDCANKSYVDRQFVPVWDSIQRNAPDNLVTFNRLILKLNPKRVVGGFLIIEPYDNIFYELLHVKKVGFLFRDFLENQVEIYLDNILVGEPYLSNKNSFLDITTWSKRDKIQTQTGKPVSKSVELHSTQGTLEVQSINTLFQISSVSKLAFKKVGAATKPQLHCELILMTKTDWEEKYH